jgi:hypothetical protein
MKDRGNFVSTGLIQTIKYESSSYPYRKFTSPSVFRGIEGVHLSRSQVPVAISFIQCLGSTLLGIRSMDCGYENYNTAKLIPEITSQFFMYLEGLRFASRAC